MGIGFVCSTGAGGLNVFAHTLGSSCTRPSLSSLATSKSSIPTRDKLSSKNLTKKKQLVIIKVYN